MRLPEKGVGVLGVYAHHEAALTAGRDGHVSADPKGQATEHPLLGDVGFAGDQLADATGEVFVVRHRGNMVAPGTRVAQERPLLDRALGLLREHALAA
jgi:hypothetical protein